ncbi:hypothetical protein PITCH_A720078 [uncultured Desulfobacterium sp.]|uniref:Uncharacterized protein n=1 Tax=uncultured Desulfobacterium sp. TaxID=201089 RepID=A0A445N212_9BACT|nr:hypothetical protein PITCH_A720078 [uncultured Desulfobacterium sp.]
MLILSLTEKYYVKSKCWINFYQSNCFGRYLANSNKRHVKFLYSFLLKTGRHVRGRFFFVPIVY